jgi:protocatechuate 3,4-dioxygenase beta subunit
MRVPVLLLLCASLAVADGAGAIEGTLLHADGSPWAGAQVVAYRVGAKESLRKVAETDAKGRYRFVGLPPGRYTLAYGPKPKPKPKDPFDDLFKGLVDDSLRAAMAAMQRPGNVFAVAAGQTVRRDIRLPQRAPVEVVVTCRGRPVRGAAVEVFRVDEKNRAGWTATVGERRDPRTDARGVASLGEVEAGRYVVKLDVGNWSVFAGVHVVKGTEVHRFPVALGEHAVRVKVLDGAGKPVDKACVGVSWDGGPTWDFVRSRDMEQLPGKGGLFRVPYVRPGRISVGINAKDDATGGAEGIEVGPDNPDPEVTVRLDPTAPLVVRVVDARGKPVPGVQVCVANADSDDGAPSFSYPVGRRGELRLQLTLHRWRARIDDFDHGEGEWKIVEPNGNDERIVVLTLPQRR